MTWLEEPLLNESGQQIGAEIKQIILTQAANDGKPELSLIGQGKMIINRIIELLIASIRGKINTVSCKGGATTHWSD